MNRVFAKVAALALVVGFAGAVRAELPDFTPLVERSSPAVVNITARKGATSASEDPSEIDPEEMPEFFRRFFGPGGPNPHQDGYPERVSGGSGFIISPEGYVLTNHHVVDGADEVTVRLQDRREFTARVVGSDPQSDVAVLKLDAENLPVVPLGDSKALKPGQWVLAIGSPFGFEHSVTAGIVSAVGRSFNNDQRYVPFIQTDVPINRGNSGGPLLNLQGEVVGINSQIFSNTGGYIGLSFAIPIDVARSVADQIRTKGKVSRGVLGVGVQEVTRDIADALELPRIGGALVGQVTPGSGAEKAGMKPQDVILSYNGTLIEHSSDLPPLVGATTPGSRASIEVFREGKALTLPIEVGELDGEVELASTRPAAKSEATNALGVSVRDLTGEEREQLGLAEEGVLVEDVTSAEVRRTGLRPGDVILMVGRTRIASASEFERQADAAKAGHSVILLVQRGDTTTFLAVKPKAEAG
jgi:serine protease Do